MPQWEYCSIRHTDQGIEYVLYRTDGAYASLLSEPAENDIESYKLARQSAIAILGMLGWEAINTLQTESHIFEDWHFKRQVHPSNQNPPF